MEPNYSYLNLLLTEIYVYIHEESREWLTKPLNKKLNKVALLWFQAANKEILSQFPELKYIVQEDENDKKPKFLFNRLVNRLHDEAKIRKCDYIAPGNLNPTARFAWEFLHYKTLMANLKDNPESTEIKDAVHKDFINFFNTAAQNPNPLETKELDLSFKGIKYIPYYILHLKNLRILKLNNNAIQNLQILSSLKNLQMLYLRHNQLEEIPREIGQLDQLTALDLSNNKLKELPEEIGNLKNLKYLHLQNNNLKKLPFSLNSRTMPKLEALCILGNELPESEN